MNRPTLMVSVDFSDCAPEVVRYAADLAVRLQGRLALVHVVEPPPGIGQDTVIRPRPEGGEMTAHAFLGKEADRLLAEYVAAVRAEVGSLEIVTEVVNGPIVDAILRTADELNAHMIVLGTHGRRGISRMVLGSIAESVVRRATRPVVTLRTQHKPTCDARGCAWCSTHQSWAQSRLRAELDG